MSKIPFHPFLFALFPLMSFVSNNLKEMNVDITLFIWALIVLSFAALIYGLSLLFWKETRKAGIVATLVIVGFLSYGHLYSLVYTSEGVFGVIGRHRYLLPSFLVILAGVMRVLLSKKIKTVEITKIFNVVGVVALLLSSTNIILNAATTSNEITTKQVIDIDGIAQRNINNRPNVYYIVLDQYPARPVLKEFYSYDNTYFVDSLSGMGFVVNDSQYSNYGITHLSLASSLSMDYLHNLGVPLSSETTVSASRLIKSYVKQNKVANIFKTAGYQFIHVGSWFGPTEINQVADVNYQGGRFNEFTSKFLLTTVLCVVDNKLFANDYRRRIILSMDYLDSLSKTSDPKFVFAHIICPHGPYVLNKNGKPIPISYDENDKRGFIGQVEYISNRTIKCVKEILSRNPNAVIIIQADHGSGLNKGKGSTNTDYVRERLMILNAIHLPDTMRSSWPPVRTPVNTFRALFNLYFQTKYEYLPERCYISKDAKNAYNLLDVTEVLIQ